MIKIAHRGNFSGRQPEENRPEYIRQAVEMGYYVEIDVWKDDENWYLGHDSPLYKTDFNFLNNANFFLHCKDLRSLLELSESGVKGDFFAHQGDDWVLTSRGKIWTYPGQETTRNSIIVDFGQESWDEKYKNIWGICADFLK